MMTINDWWNKLYDEHEDIYDFVFVVKSPDGKEYASSHYNLTGGTCSCCQELDIDVCKVIKIYNGITLDVVFSEY